MGEMISQYFNDQIKMRVGRTWSQLMNCQDGSEITADGGKAFANPLEDDSIPLMLRFLPDKNIKILDIGAGGGGEIINMRNGGYSDVTGITFGKGNVKVAKEQYGIDLHFMDMHFTTFPNDYFDAIVGFQVFEHSPAPILCGLEFLRILKDGGKLLLEMPMGEKSFPFDTNMHHLNTMVPWIAKHTIRKCGFTNIVVENHKPENFFLYGEKHNHGNDIDSTLKPIVEGEFLRK